MKLEKVLVVCYKDTYGTETHVRKTLAKQGIDAQCINRDTLSAKKLKGADLVITVGGDGTFLRASQFVRDQPVLCVVSSLRYNEGFFSRASKEDFAKKLKLIIGGKHKVVELNRLEAIIMHGRHKLKTEYAVNEVFIGSRKPYHTARYWLHVGKKQEFQKSSGVIIATGAGSNAWNRSAGGISIPLSSKKMVYIVREPYTGRLTKPKLTKGVISGKSTIRVKSMNWDGIVVIDSRHKEYKFNEGASITVRDSKLPLNFVEF